MATSDPVTQFLLLAQIAAAVCVLARMAASGLLARYCWFSIYLALDIERNAMLMPLRPAAYAYSWVVSQPIILFSFVLVTYELYRLVLEKYQGLASVGRWFLWGATLTALCAAGLILILSAPTEPNTYPVLRLVLLATQTISLTLLFFLLLLLLFLIYYPVELTRNTVLHAFLFTILFLCRGVGYFAVNQMGDSIRAGVNLAMMLIPLACLFAWVIWFTRPGEERTVVVGHRWSTVDGGELMRRLDSINASLLRSSRQ